MATRRTGSSALHAHDHAHGHSDAHGAAAHVHSVPAGSVRALAAALALTAGFALVEAVGGWLAGSLALLSDAGHMITDAAALAIALVAQWIARKPPSAHASYGYARAEVLAAFVNALALLLLIAFIVWEAVKRMLEPAPVAGGAVMAIAAAGLCVNGATAWIVSRASRTQVTRSVLIHVASDALGSFAALVAGLVVVVTGWTPIDPLLSLAIALLILRATWRLLTQATGVLMEGVPAHLDYEAIGRALSTIDGIESVHDLHVWHMDAEEAALSAHVVITSGAHWPQILDEACRMLDEQYAIGHITLQPSWRADPRYADRRVIPIAEASGGSETG